MHEEGKLIESADNLGGKEPAEQERIATDVGEVIT